MSLRLILIRHAKSDWSAPDLDDHDRPLTPRGRRAARAIGTWLADRGHLPEVALLSTAIRARETWGLIAPELGTDPPIHLKRRLYHAAPETMLGALAERTELSVLLVAHNPGLAALAKWLVIDTPERVEFHRFPTGATLVLSIGRDRWSDLGERCAQVEDFVVPRDLTDQ